VRTRIAIVILAVSGLFAAMACSASALTLGTTTFPSGATPAPCTSGAFYVQGATDSAYQYAVPSAGGQITSWSTNAAGATAGTPLTLLVLQPSGGGYTIVGFDPEILPTPLPVSGVATFSLASPITVTGGDLLGVYASATTAACYFTGGTTPPADVSPAALVSPPSVGATYTPTVSLPTALVNLSAELVQSQDVGVSGSAMPASITAGGVSEYAFAVSNGGVASGAITFTDAIPSGLTILSAVAGSGSCSTVGPTVTCTISGLEAGEGVPVSIIVATPTAGSYPDVATVSASLADPNPANNVARTTLTVNAPAVTSPPPPPCKTIALAGAPLAIAKIVIPALNCKLGKVTSKASKTVHKGLVISTSPGAGATLAAGSTVNIVVSSGPPKKKEKKRKKKH
jgi:uncharacterized repeat protein (TIGR01451 family)